MLVKVVDGKVVKPRGRPGFLFGVGCACCSTLISPNECCGYGETRPPNFFVTVSGMSGSYGCLGIQVCPNFNGMHILGEGIAPYGPCQWSKFISTLCGGNPGILLGCDATDFVLTFYGLTAATNAIYKKSLASWDYTVLGSSNIMAYVSNTCGFCETGCLQTGSGWPATMTVTS